MDIQNNNYKYYDWITGIFVAVLIISNVVSSKVARIGIFNFDGGTILFPIAYIFGDILTEVYGYAKSRKIIWIGFTALILMAASTVIVQFLPPAPDWPNQAAYEAIIGFVPRLVFARIVAYWLGEFSNSYVLAKMKVWTQGKWLWTRTIGSTIIGEGVDTVIFTSIAFYGVLSLGGMFNLMATIYVFKVLFEILATPLTYKIVAFLKKEEGVDVYDTNTNFNPFAVSKAE